jgi:hypothetical protein
MYLGFGGLISLIIILYMLFDKSGGVHTSARAASRP